jgi:hypothetical protein
VIKQFFPSKKVKLPVVHLPYQNSPFYVPPVAVHTSLTEEQRAARKGLSIEEYRSRVVAVAKAQAFTTLKVGDRGMPIKEKDALNIGECVVVGICRHFEDYGTVQWHEPPFILSVSPVNNRSKTINCTANWLTTKTSTGVC